MALRLWQVRPHNTRELLLTARDKKHTGLFCCTLTTFKEEFRPRPHRITAFHTHWFSSPHFMALRLWQMRPQATSTTTTPNRKTKPRRNTNSQHQATNIHNTRTQDSQQKSVHCHVGKNSYFCVIMSFKWIWQQRRQITLITQTTTSGHLKE